MKKDLKFHLSNERILPKFQKLLNLIEGEPILLIYQRYTLDLKTVDSHIIGAMVEGEIINERTGIGEPVLMENELEYAVFCMYGFPYIPDSN